MQERAEASPDAALRTLLVAPGVHHKEAENDGDSVQEANGEPLAHEQHDHVAPYHLQQQLDESLPLSPGNGQVGSGATTARDSSAPAAADAQLKQLRQEKAQLSQRLRAVEEAAAEALGELEDVKVSRINAVYTR